MDIWSKRWRTVLAVLIGCVQCLLGSPGSAQAATAQAPPVLRLDDAATASHMRAAIDQVGAHGGAWVVVDPDGAVHAGAAGIDGDGNPFSADTPVLIGSVSKPIAAAVTVDLAERGVLDLDRPVVDLLQQFRNGDPRRLRVTVRQLLAHTSGLPFGADMLDITEPDRTPASVVAEMRDVRLEGEPGDGYRYSSLGYVVLAAVVEAVTGRRFGDLVSARFPDAGLVTTRDRAQLIPPGYRSALLPVPQVAPYDPAGLAYGYLGGSARTLAAVGQAELADRGGLAAMTDVHPPAGGTLTGLGWRVNDDPAGRLVWHTGTVPGYFTALFIVPGTGRVAAFVVNVSGAMDDDRLYGAAHRLLDLMRGGVPSAGPSPLPPPLTRWVLVGGIALCAAASWWLCTRRRASLHVAGVVVGAGLCSVPWSGAALLDVPVRYVRLWAPEMWSAPTVGVVVLASAVVVLVRRRARTPRLGEPTAA